MTRTTRDTLYANMGRDAVLRTAAIQAQASQYEQMSVQLAQQPPTLSEEAAQAVSFNFSTGTWGDGRSV